MVRRAERPEHLAHPVRQPRDLGGGARPEPSATVRARVERARSCQRRRGVGVGASCNARLPGQALEREGAVGAEARALLVSAADRLGLSARAFYRVLRVARTIADLEEDACVAAGHVAEALRYRPVPTRMAVPAAPP